MKKRIENKILKREYLRGYTNGLPKDIQYTLSDLNAEYRRYKKLNNPKIW